MRIPLPPHPPPCAQRSRLSTLTRISRGAHPYKPDYIMCPGELQVEVEAVREERADLQQRLRSAERHLARLRVPEVRAAGFLPRACQ